MGSLGGVAEGGEGRYSTQPRAARLLDEQSNAGRAVVGDAVRAHLQALRQFNPRVIPMVLADDARVAAGKRPSRYPDRAVSGR